MVKTLFATEEEYNHCMELYGERGEIMWNCTRLVRATDFLRKVRVRNDKGKISRVKTTKFLTDSVLICTYVSVELHSALTREAAILSLVPNHVKKWYPKIKKYFGKDVAELVAEVQQFFKDIENEEYENLDSYSRECKIIVQAHIIAVLANELSDKEKDVEEKSFACQYAMWQASTVDYGIAMVKFAIEKMVRDFEHHEGIEIIEKPAYLQILEG